MTDQGAASTAEARRDPVQLRIERDTRLVLRGLGYGLAALGLLFVWFIHLGAQLEGPDLDPIVTFGIAAAIGSAILAACVLKRKSSVSRLLTLVALIGLYMGLLAATGTFDEDEPKVMRFHAAYRSIRTGMSAAEVQAAVAAQYPDQKPTINYHPGGWFVGPLDPTDWRYNAEFFAVIFRNGVVVTKSYLPD